MKTLALLLLVGCAVTHDQAADCEALKQTACEALMRCLPGNGSHALAMGICLEDQAKKVRCGEADLRPCVDALNTMACDPRYPSPIEVTQPACAGFVVRQ